MQMMIVEVSWEDSEISMENEWALRTSHCWLLIALIVVVFLRFAAAIAIAMVGQVLRELTLTTHTSITGRENQEEARETLFPLER